MADTETTIAERREINRTLLEHVISLTVISVNYIGDGLRDAMDPKLRSR